MDKPRLLFLVRHGRSDETSGHLSPTPRGPQWDPPLDETGRQQAALLATRLMAMDPQPAGVYCSPLRRARETLEPYASGATIAPVFDEDLMEANVGEWEGRSFEELLAGDAELLERFRKQDAIWGMIPGAESKDGVRERVEAAVSRMLQHHPEGDLLVIAHGGVINAYLGGVLGIEREMFFLPDNTSVNTVELNGRGERTVRFLNDVRHLTDPALFPPR